MSRSAGFSTNPAAQPTDERPAPRISQPSLTATVIVGPPAVGERLLGDIVDIRHLNPQFFVDDEQAARPAA